jgi:uncharacterized membrane protein YdjX (TVP38/TMEM64 family)
MRRSILPDHGAAIPPIRPRDGTFRVVVWMRPLRPMTPEIPSDTHRLPMSLVWRAIFAGLVLIAAGIVLARTVDPTRWLTANGLRAAVGADEWYGSLSYVSTIVAAMFLPIPKLVVLGLGGVLFGPWYGFAYAWLGQILGMTVLFVIARSGFQALARRLVHQHVEAARRIDAHLEDRGISVVAALRLFYFMGTPLSIMLSTTRLRLRHFVAGTAIGVVPAVALAVASGDAVASGATGFTAAVIGVSLVLVVGLGTVVRRRFGI